MSPEDDTPELALLLRFLHFLHRGGFCLIRMDETPEDPLEVSRGLRALLERFLEVDGHAPE